MKKMGENDIATIVLDAAFKIHREPGPGLFEAVYEPVMEYELVNEQYRSYGKKQD